MFDVQLVRTLCQEITEEKDLQELELLHLLQAVIKDDQEEVRLRMSSLTRKYAAVVQRFEGGGLVPVFASSSFQYAWRRTRSGWLARLRPQK